MRPILPGQDVRFDPHSEHALLRLRGGRGLSDSRAHDALHSRVRMRLDKRLRLVRTRVRGVTIVVFVVGVTRTYDRCNISSKSQRKQELRLVL